jgi:hypothetical protein
VVIKNNYQQAKNGKSCGFTLAFSSVGEQRRETPNAPCRCVGYSEIVAKKPAGFAREEPGRHQKSDQTHNAIQGGLCKKRWQPQRFFSFQMYVFLAFCPIDMGASCSLINSI